MPRNKSNNTGNDGEPDRLHRRYNESVLQLNEKACDEQNEGADCRETELRCEYTAAPSVHHRNQEGDNHGGEPATTVA
jgi:hypothetical protein